MSNLITQTALHKYEALQCKTALMQKRECTVEEIDALRLEYMDLGCESSKDKDIDSSVLRLIFAAAGSVWDKLVNYNVIYHVVNPGKAAYRKNGCWVSRDYDRDRKPTTLCGGAFSHSAPVMVKDVNTSKKLQAQKALRPYLCPNCESKL